MKKLTVILFDAEKDANTICESFSTLPEKIEVRGIIEYRR